MWTVGLLCLAGLGAAAEDSSAPQADDPDLLLWLAADDQGTLDMDERGFVSQWRSKATRIGSHVAATGDRRPQWIADAWRDRPAVRFDGQDDVLHNEQFRQAARCWTLLLVVAPHANVGSGIPDGYHCFFSANAPGHQDFISGLNVDMGGRETERLDVLNVEGSRGGGETNLLFVSSDWGQPRVLAVWAGPDQTTLFAESVRQASRQASDALTSLDEIRVGARRDLPQNESGFVAADIAEVMLYARALSSRELEDRSRYLEAKYGVEPTAATPTRMSLDDALAALITLSWDRSRACLAPIDDVIRGDDSQARQSLVLRLAALLERRDISDAAVDAICRRLESLGTEASLAALRELLMDPTRFPVALRAVQLIPGPQACQILVAALTHAEPSQQVMLIRALSARRELHAVSLLLEKLHDPDTQVAAAAAAALCHIGDPDTISALLDSPAPTPYDLLTLVHHLVPTHPTEARLILTHLAAHSNETIQAAVFRELVALEPAAAAQRLQDALRGDQPRLRSMAAQALAQDCSEPLATQVLASFLDLPAAAQRTLLGMRWSRQLAVGRDVALQSLRAVTPQVRDDGLRLLAEVGEASDIDRLVRVATEDTDPQVRSGAEAALRRLAATGTDAAIIQQMASAQGPACRVLIRAVRDRRSTGAESDLQPCCTAVDPETRLEAFTAMQTLGTPKSASLLIMCLGAASSVVEQAAIERALAQCCLRVDGAADPMAALGDAYEGSDVTLRTRLLPVLGRVGGERALALVRTALADREPVVRAAAVRGLANWPDASVADDLLQLAQRADTPDQRIWAIRGFVRVVSLAGARANDQTVALLRQAWRLATRNEERRLILQRLPAAVCPEALALALESLHDPELGGESVFAAAQLAEALLPIDPPVARAAIHQILEVCADPTIIARLRRHVSQE